MDWAERLPVCFGSLIFLAGDSIHGSDWGLSGLDLIMVARMVGAHTPHGQIRVGIVREGSPHGCLPTPESTATASGSIGAWGGVGEMTRSARKGWGGSGGLAIIEDIKREGIIGERGFEHGRGHW